MTHTDTVAVLRAARAITPEIYQRCMNPSPETGYPSDEDLEIVVAAMDEAIRVSDLTQAGFAVSDFYRRIKLSVENIQTARSWLREGV